VSDQINLRKKLKSKATPWIDWHGSMFDTTFRWMQQLHRNAMYVQDGDITDGETKCKDIAAAQAARQRAVEKKLAEGFEYVGEPPAAPEPEEQPSKPWPKGKAKPPRWLGKAPKAELARVRAAIANAKLDHRRADIESLLRPAIWLTPKPAKSVKGVVTRFGGDPDVPATFAWPHHEKVPLAFLAQYRLDELAKLDLEHRLPKRGVLSIFAYLVPDDNMKYGELAVAFHFPDVKKLVRTAPPHDREADRRPRALATATAKIVLTVPPAEHRAAESLKLGDESDRYHDEVWLATCGEAPAHQLLGWPNALAAPGMSASNELLAQIDSDDRFGFELGDVETLRIFIASKQLAVGSFAKLLTTTSQE
jgi:hypothetical protein